MEGNVLKLVEFLVVVGLVLGFCGRELWILKKLERERQAKNATAQQETGG